MAKSTVEKSRVNRPDCVSRQDMKNPLNGNRCINCAYKYRESVIYRIDSEQ